MLTLLAPQPESLWDESLPVEVKQLLEDLAALDGLLTDPELLWPLVERWREAGTAPEQIVAEHVSGNNVDMTRPLCPYPQVATYKGVGSTNDAASFTCKVP